MGLWSYTSPADITSYTECMTEIKESACTQLINGVSVCSEPKYPVIHDPGTIKLADIVLSKENGCIRFDHVPDMVGQVTYDRFRANFGHGDIPDNYVCYDGAKVNQYATAMLPPANLLRALGNATVSLDRQRSGR